MLADSQPFATSSLIVIFLSALIALIMPMPKVITGAARQQENESR
ncbi:hypothetical protein yrohd0001_13450 [Yersinia rohdei ATCC 43380]|nr:hypothetical protein yrohd0001_13450 [Yersinia rohdei ATCC 43380]